MSLFTCAMYAENDAHNVISVFHSTFRQHSTLILGNMITAICSVAVTKLYGYLIYRYLESLIEGW